MMINEEEEEEEKENNDDDKDDDGTKYYPRLFTELALQSPRPYGELHTDTISSSTHRASRCYSFLIISENSMCYNYHPFT